MTNNYEASFASSLLPHIGNHPEIAGLLFDTTPWVRHLDGVPLPDATCLAALRQGASKAEVAAHAATGPEVLRRMARDSRKGVRHLVASNPHTPADALGVLWRRAVKADDEASLKAALPRVPYQDIEDSWEQAVCVWRGLEDKYLTIAQAVAQRGDLHEHLAVLRSGRVRVAAELLNWLAAHPGPLGLTDAVSHCPDESRSAIVTWAMASSNCVGAELAQLFVSYGTWDQVQRVDQGSNAYRSGGSTASFVDIEALRILLDTAPPIAGLRWLASCPLPAELVDEVLEVIVTHRDLVSDAHSASLALAAFVVANNSAGHLTGAHLRRIVDTLSPLHSQGLRHVGAAIGQQVPADADTDVLFLALESSSYRPSSLISWLSGKLGRDPRPGEILQWVGDDSTTESWHHSRRVELADRVLRYGHFEALATKPWAKEVLDALGPELPRFLRLEDEVAKFVVNQLTDALGDDREAWMTFMSLADDLGAEPLDDLISAVQAIHGLD